MSNFIDEVIKNANDQIKYSNTITTGEITVDNGDGTYDVKINNAGSAIPDVETLDYDAAFSVGEIVTIGFENGCKESPKILGHSKKIKQEPKPVEVDYSGEEGGGVQGGTVTIAPSTITPSGSFIAVDSNYNTVHDSINGSDLVYPEGTAFEILYLYMTIGQSYIEYGPYEPYPTYNYYHMIDRGALILDTSAIPANAIITSAKLQLWMAVESTINFDVIVQDGQPNNPHNPIVNSDYDCSKYKNNGGSINTLNINDGVYNDITLNSNGRAWINKGGMTKFCLRSSRDIAGIPAASGTTAVSNFVYAAYDDPLTPPKLTITYTI